MKIGLLVGLVLIMFLFSFMPVSAVSDFTTDARDFNLGFFSKLRLDSQTFTIAGEERSCSVDPINSGVLQVGECKRVGVYPNLINKYRIPPNGGDWIYLGEYEAPTDVCDSSYMSAWEEYSCSILTDECSDGEKRCRTDTTAETCINGNWVQQYCTGGDECSEGECGTFGECLGNDGNCWDEKNGHFCVDNYFEDVSCSVGEICSESAGGCTSSGTCTEGWICRDAWTQTYQLTSCGTQQDFFCEYGCNQNTGRCNFESDDGGDGGIITGSGLNYIVGSHTRWLEESTITKKCNLISTVEIRNDNDFSVRGIIELQVAKRSEPLSFFSREIKTCDPDHPENVHVEINIAPHETTELQFRNPIDTDGKYNIWLMAREECYSGTVKRINGNMYNSVVIEAMNVENCEIDEWWNLDWLTKLGITFGAIASLFALFFGNKFFRKSLRGKNRKYAFIGGLLLAGLTFYLVYLTWWLGLIALIGYIIIMKFTKGVRK